MLDLPQPSEQYDTSRERVRNERIRREFDKVLYKDEFLNTEFSEGDVVGPAVSGVDRVATYADTTGKLLKDSGVLITDLAPKASPAFTGTPVAPTAAPGTNTTQISTTAFVKAAIDVVLGGVGAAFDTLSEIATELGLKATLASPTFTGDPKAPTPAPGDNDTSLATTAFVAAALLAAGAASGDIKMIAHSTIPSGWSACDGGLLNRTTEAALFAAIGTAWGAGDGSTTFAKPDLRGRVPVGAGTGTVAETQAAANFNVSDTITVDSNPMNTKPKWLTGMPVIVTTSGVLPTGIVAATTYFVRRLSATTIALYTSFALAMNGNSVTGRVNITATGSGNHTITCTMSVRAVAELFGVELSADVPSHTHGIGTAASGAGDGTVGRSPSAVSFTVQTSAIGDAEGITNMPPSAVVQYIIKLQEIIMGWFSDLFSGSSEVKTKQPAWYTAAAQKAVDLSGRAADIGYIPYQGADVAAFTPQQKEAMQGAQNRFTTFNSPGAAIPQVQDALMPETDFGGGLKGYSSHGGYTQEMAKLAAAYPGIAEMLKSFSKSPYGAPGAPQPGVTAGPGSTGPTPYVPPPTPLVQPPAPIPPVTPPGTPPRPTDYRGRPIPFRYPGTGGIGPNGGPISNLGLPSNPSGHWRQK